MSNSTRRVSLLGAITPEEFENLTLGEIEALAARAQRDLDEVRGTAATAVSRSSWNPSLPHPTRAFPYKKGDETLRERAQGPASGKAAKGAWPDQPDAALKFARARAQRLLGAGRLWLLQEEWGLLSGARVLLDSRAQLDRFQVGLEKMGAELYLPRPPAGTDAADLLADFKRLRARTADAVELNRFNLQLYEQRGLDPDSHLRRDQLASIALRRAIEDARVRLPNGAGRFSPSGLAFAAIALGIDEPPLPRETAGLLELNREQVFREDHVSRWKKILGRISQS